MHQIIKPQMQFTLLYDFGDSREIQLCLEKLYMENLKRLQFLKEKYIASLRIVAGQMNLRNSVTSYRKVFLRIQSIRNFPSHMEKI